MSKGSKPRPMEVDKEQFNKNFDAIFGKKKGDKKDDTKTKEKPNE